MNIISARISHESYRRLRGEGDVCSGTWTVATLVVNRQRDGSALREESDELAALEARLEVRCCFHMQRGERKSGDHVGARAQTMKLKRFASRLVFDKFIEPFLTSLSHMPLRLKQPLSDGSYELVVAARDY